MTVAARGARVRELPAGTLLPTTVIGSYAVPEWLGQLKNDYCQRRISSRSVWMVSNRFFALMPVLPES